MGCKVHLLFNKSFWLKGLQGRYESCEYFHLGRIFMGIGVSLYVHEVST